MIVRELITRLGFRTDEAAVKRYDAQYAALKRSAAGVATVVTAIGVAGARAFKNLADRSEGFLRLRGATRATVEDLQRMKYLAEQNEASWEEVSQALVFLHRNTGLRPTVELMERLADQVAGMRPEQRLGYLAKLFGPRGAVGMANVLQGGSKAVRELVRDFDRMNVTIDERGVRSVDKFSDSIARLLTLIRGKLDMAFVAIIPALQQLTDFIDRDPKRAFANFAGGLLFMLALLGRWRILFAGLLALATEDIRKWQRDQESVIGGVLGKWETFVDTVGPYLKMLHDLMFGESGEGGIWARQKARMGQLASGDVAGYAGGLIADHPASMALEAFNDWGRRLGAERAARYAATNGPPLMLAPQVNVTVPPGTPQFQADFIGEVVRRSILGAAADLNAAHPEAEHGR